MTYKSTGVIFHETEEWCKVCRKIDLWFGKWHEEFDKFFPEHSKVSKVGLWRDPFIKSRKCISLKFTEGLCVMTMKNDAKFEEELTCRFKIEVFDEFWPERSKVSKNFHFNVLFLKKVYNVSAKKVQRSYVWWHWRLMQILKENWLVL